MISKDIISKSIEEAIRKCKYDPYVLHRKDKKFLNELKFDDFQEDKQTNDPQREELEEAQQQYQKEKVKITREERDELLDYSGINFEFINDKIYNDKRFRELIRKGLIDEDDEDLSNSIHTLNKALNKGKGLLQDTILYRFGHWDNLKEGEIGVWDGITSTTYQEESSYTFDNSENRKLLKIYAPKGTKGLVINQDNGLAQYNEHEFLMPSNVRYYVLSNNNDEIEILLLPK